MIVYIKMECTICCNEYSLDQMGVACSTCHQKCCIHCDSQNQTCPFCRGQTLPWKERIQQITVKQLQHYLEVYNSKNQMDLEKFKRAKDLFIAMMCDVPGAYEYFDKIDDDDFLYNLMLVARDYIYNTAMVSKNIDDIDFLLEFIEDIYDRIESSDVCIDLDMDEVEDLLFGVSSYSKKTTYFPSKCMEHFPKNHHVGYIRRRHHYHVLTD